MVEYDPNSNPNTLTLTLTLTLIVSLCTNLDSSPCHMTHWELNAILPRVPYDRPTIKCWEASIEI